MQFEQKVNLVSRDSMFPQQDGALAPATSYPAIVGAVLVGLRERKKITQAELAARMGLAASTWSRIENGSSALSIDQLARVAQELEVRPGEIMEKADRAQDVAAERKVRLVPERISPAEAVGPAKAW